MGEIILFLSAFSFIAIDGIIKTIRDKEDFDIQGKLIKKLIVNKTTTIISLLLPLVCWFQIFDFTPISIFSIITINTMLTLLFSKIIAIPFLLRSPREAYEYSINRGIRLINTTLIAIATLIAGSILINI